MVNQKLAMLDSKLSQRDSDMISRIKSIKQDGNFHTMRKTFGEQKLISLIGRLYPKNDIKTLEKIMNVPDSSLSYWFKQLGIKTTRRHISNSAIPADFDGCFVLNTQNTTTNINAINIDEGLAYLIGFCIGDGSVEKYSIEVFNKDTGMKKYLENVMKPYGKVKQRLRPDGLWKLRLSGVKIANLIKRNKAIREDTLDYILSDDELAGRFLAGLWDAEGSVLRQGKYFHIYLYNSNKRLIDKISEFLGLGGMDTTIIPMKKRENEYYLQGRKVVAKKTVYRLGIPKKHFKQWAEMIGLHLKHSRKSAVVKDILMEVDSK